MIKSQLDTFRHHNGKISKYDIISVFLLRSSELLNVFINQVDYFRLCYVEQKPWNEETIESGLNAYLVMWHWFDCLGRRIKIRKWEL